MVELVGRDRGDGCLDPAAWRGDDRARDQALAAVASFQLAAGIGKRATEWAGYTNAGLPAERIFIKLAELADEVSADLAAVVRPALRATRRCVPVHSPHCRETIGS
jgi:hypothetical protein